MTVDEGLAKGDLKFVVEGERMRGGWVLVRMAHDRNAKAGKKGRTNWLLIKHRDGTEHAGDADALLTGNDSSVASGRSLAEIAAGAAPGPTRFITAEPGAALSKRARTPAKRVWNSNRGDPEASAGGGGRSRAEARACQAEAGSQARGRVRGAAPALHPAPARAQRGPAPGGCGVGARDQVRRLPPATAGARRRLPGADAQPAWTGRRASWNWLSTPPSCRPVSTTARR